jgi:hypothetical protein
MLAGQDVCQCSIRRPAPDLAHFAPEGSGLSRVQVAQQHLFGQQSRRTDHFKRWPVYDARPKPLLKIPDGLVDLSRG